MSAPDRKPLAVALHYEHGGVPRVTAKGRGPIADAILERAREHDVPIEENPALAEALATLDLDREIPVELYRAVAEVIGFVLRTSRRMGG
jgi:flagellar biosynthesis protein